MVAPHHTWWNPTYMAFAARPKEPILMAKKELFMNYISGWWIRICGAFPIDCKNPGQKVLKYPISMLKKSNRPLVMFPSGSCHSTGVKGEVAVVARMAKVKIIPVVYAGLTELGGLLTGERADMNSGNPTDISDIKRMDDERIEEVANRVQTEFDRLDAENATYHTNKKPNPLAYIYRIPLGLVVIIVVLLTLLFNYVASFVWDPDKHCKMK